MAGKVLHNRGFRALGGRNAKTSWARLAAANAEIGRGSVLIDVGAGATLITGTTLSAATLVGVSTGWRVSGSTRTTAVASDPAYKNLPKYSEWVEIWTPDQLFVGETDAALAASPEIVLPTDSGAGFQITGYSTIDSNTKYSNVTIDLSTKATPGTNEIVIIVDSADMPENDLIEGIYPTMVFKFANDRIFGEAGGYA